jgi:aspartyl/asparaginyl-tRNA synthetase
MSKSHRAPTTHDHVAGMADLARKHGELAQASHQVISRRLELAASPNVLTADGQAEMARMVPEKAHAFARSGSEAVFHLNAMLLRAGSDWLRETTFAAQATTHMLTAATPAAALQAQQDYLAGLSQRMAAAGNALVAASTALQAAALAPVHRTATSNARRLKR